MLPRVRAFPTPPPGYRMLGSIDLVPWSRPLLIGSVLLFFGALPLFNWLCRVLGPAPPPTAVLLPEALPAFLVALTMLQGGLALGGIATTGVVLALHELTHGLVLACSTRVRPRFGRANRAFLYTAAPGWYIPRWWFVGGTLAPLVILTCAGVLALWAGVVPSAAYPAWIWGLAIHAAGSVGDLVTTALLLTRRGPLVIENFGTRFVCYGPARTVPPGGPGRCRRARVEPYSYGDDDGAPASEGSTAQRAERLPEGALPRGDRRIGEQRAQGHCQVSVLLGEGS